MTMSFAPGSVPSETTAIVWPSGDNTGWRIQKNHEGPAVLDPPVDDALDACRRRLLGTRRSSGRREVVPAQPAVHRVQPLARLLADEVDPLAVRREARHRVHARVGQLADVLAALDPDVARLRVDDRPRKRHLRLDDDDVRRRRRPVRARAGLPVPLLPPPNGTWLFIRLNVIAATTRRAMPATIGAM